MRSYRIVEGLEIDALDDYRRMGYYIDVDCQDENGLLVLWKYE